jgi:hypothetical protein
MSAEGGKRAARGAQDAAEAQQRAAEVQYGRMKEITDRATTSGIASFERDLMNQEKNLSRQEQLISQIDPTIIEASQQALRLMRGEASSTLSPLKNQRATQRQKLLNSLREQLGPGAETSTAGIQALTRFDSETDNIFAGAQQQALSNLGNISSQFSSQRPDMMREIMGRSQLGQGQSNLLFGQAQLLSGQGQNLINSAGAQFAGDVMRGNQQQGFGNALLGGAVTAGTAGVTSYYGKKE